MSAHRNELLGGGRLQVRSRLKTILLRDVSERRAGPAYALRGSPAQYFFPLRAWTRPRPFFSMREFIPD
jgi:hypothetical protein